MSERRQCLPCHGTGSVPSEDSPWPPLPCAVCGGDGWTSPPVSAPDHLTPAHGPSRVPGMRRTGAQEGLGGRLSGPQGADGGREGSGVPEPPQGHAAAMTVQDWREWARTARWTIPDDDLAAPYRALSEAYRDLTRQRDEAVKAFQRERARVGRVEELERKWSEPTFASFLTGTHAAGDLRAALADRPTDD